MSVVARAFVVPPGKGEQRHALGLTAIEKIRSADTDGTCYAFEVLAPPGFGIPPHIHSHEDEVLYVIEGEYAIALGDERLRAGPRSVRNELGMTMAGGRSTAIAVKGLVRRSAPFCGRFGASTSTFD